MSSAKDLVHFLPGRPMAGSFRMRLRPLRRVCAGTSGPAKVVSSPALPVVRADDDDFLVSVAHLGRRTAGQDSPDKTLQVLLELVDAGGLHRFAIESDCGGFYAQDSGNLKG